MECAAILGACQVLDVGDPRLIAEGRTFLFRIVSTLSKMGR
jgi:hypothetical protein